MSSPLTTPSWQQATRRRTRVFVIAALILALLAGASVYFWLDGIAKQSLPTTPVLVAAADIPAGATLDESLVKTQNVPSALVPENHLTLPSQAVGRVAQVPLVKGEVILPGKLVGGQASGGVISARLPNGLWAINVPINWFVAPPPEMARGDRIEIAAYTPGEPAEKAGLIVSAVEIIADPDSASLVLAVTLEQALALLRSHANGDPLLILLRPAGG